MNLLVAGGAGFIGRTLCARLVGRGDQVVCMDNLITGSADNVEALLGQPGFSFLQADIAEEDTVARGGVEGLLTGPLDAIINLACPASPVDFGPLALEITQAGSAGLRNLLELAVRHGALFLQASTSEVYGDPAVHPQPETYWGNVNPVGPRAVYDEAKRFGEALVMAYHRRHSLQVRIARIFNTYGPGMRPDDGRLVSNFVSQALRGEPLTVYGDGTQTRSLCYVDDLVDGLLALLASDQTGPVNLGNDDERTVEEIARLVAELTGSAGGVVHRPLPPDDPCRRRPDLTLARRELGWQPSTPLREGLQATIAWFRARLQAEKCR